ncbi:hypothetical protein HMPREF0569_0639 [Micrococcus luteus SK58]|nr:hypothetical protein HMPREF0569_0639 [Micrococcus luteus SK58]
MEGGPARHRRGVRLPHGLRTSMAGLACAVLWLWSTPQMGVASCSSSPSSAPTHS